MDTPYQWLYCDQAKHVYKTSTHVYQTMELPSCLMACGTGQGVVPQYGLQGTKPGCKGQGVVPQQGLQGTQPGCKGCSTSGQISALFVDLHRGQSTDIKCSSLVRTLQQPPHTHAHTHTCVLSVHICVLSKMH